MQAIETKYHGPTNTKGARISATSVGGTRVYLPYDHAFDIDELHKQAAKKLTTQLEWYGRRIGGHTKAGMVWVREYAAPEIY